MFFRLKLPLLLPLQRATLGQVRHASASSASKSQRRALPRKGTSSSPKPEPSVATKLFSLRIEHRQLQAVRDETRSDKVALAAWQLLQSVGEEDVDRAPLDDVAEMLATWAYFSRFWDRGLDGPGHSSPPLSSESSLDALGVPVVSRQEQEARAQATQREDAMPPPPRRSPLDEVLEF